MKKLLLAYFWLSFLPGISIAQQSASQVKTYMDSLSHLGSRMVNNEDDLERKNANYQFIKTLVSVLRTPNSFNIGFDSVKSISVLTSPDRRFRIFTWHVMNLDGSYRFYGTIQMNSAKLLMHPLEDYSPLLKNAEDSVTDNHKWYGAQYYKIIQVPAATPYYVMLGWKGNTVKSTKKVIEVLLFKNDKPVLGAPVFDSKGKTRKRVIFEYTRQASMLLRHVPEQNLIVFDHLAPPDKRMAAMPETYGPDLSYDGYKLKAGKWQLVEDIDMRNIPAPTDPAQFTDPKKEARQARDQVRKTN